MNLLKYFTLSLFIIVLFSCSGTKDQSKDASDAVHTGMFTYMADANMFFPCDGGQRIPIAMTGEYLTLEKKYMALTEGSGKRIYVRLEGQTKEVPAMEGNGTMLALVVSKVLEVDDSKSCD